MKIGITGGAGFIGTYVAERAIASGHKAVIFDRRGNLPDSAWSHKTEIFLGDVLDPVAMNELAKHVDGIIHLAACLGTQETIKNPLPAHRTNTEGGLNFLAACAAEDIPGTYICVGNSGHKNTYSISKTTVEHYVDMYNAEHGTRVNKIRVVNAYGPRQSVAPPFGPAKVKKITPAFICRALTGQPLEVYGNGEQISDMVHVKDAARALVSALEYASLGHVIKDAVEVGPAHHLTVNQVAEIIRSTVQRLYGIPQSPFRYSPMRPGEPERAVVVADYSTLGKIGMHYTELVPFEKGIEETIRWFHSVWLPSYAPDLQPVG